MLSWCRRTSSCQRYLVKTEILYFWLSIHWWDAPNAKTFKYLNLMCLYKILHAHPNHQNHEARSKLIERSISSQKRRKGCKKYGGWGMPSRTCSTSSVRQRCIVQVLEIRWRSRAFPPLPCPGLLSSCFLFVSVGEGRIGIRDAFRPVHRKNNWWYYGFAVIYKQSCWKNRDGGNGWGWQNAWTQTETQKNKQKFQANFSINNQFRDAFLVANIILLAMRQTDVCCLSFKTI